MAKRYAPSERPFQPIEEALLKNALADADPQGPARDVRAPLVVPRVERPASPSVTTGIGPAQVLASPGVRERLNAPLKVHLQPAERRELNRLLNQLSTELGTTVSASHVQRALITILQHAEGELLKRAREHGPMKRPPNDNLAAIAAFEFRLAKMLYGGMRIAPPLRETPRE